MVAVTAVPSIAMVSNMGFFSGWNVGDRGRPNARIEGVPDGTLGTVTAAYPAKKGSLEGTLGVWEYSVDFDNGVSVNNLRKEDVVSA